MVSPRTPEPKPPTALHDRAMDDLRFIRQAMERSGSFTAVPGWGGVAIGATGLLAALVASQQHVPGPWIAAGTLALKARRARVPLSSGPGRKFLMGFLPAVGLSVAMTAALYLHGATALLPGLWLLGYGAAVVSAGTFSVRAIPMMGIGFMALGTAALATPAGWGDAWMAAGFGGLHLGFGYVIARRHGG